MKIAVIGASGNVGARIVAELARRGHRVTAIARSPEKIAAQPHVTALRGDIADQGSLTQLLAGHDATVSSVRFVDTDPAKLIAGRQRFGRSAVISWSAAPVVSKWLRACA